MIKCNFFTKYARCTWNFALGGFSWVPIGGKDTATCFITFKTINLNLRERSVRASNVREKAERLDESWYLLN